MNGILLIDCAILFGDHNIRGADCGDPGIEFAFGIDGIYVTSKWYGIWSAGGTGK